MKHTYDVHKLFIYNIGILKRRNTYDFLIQARNFFLLPLSYKVFRHKERGTIFLCWLFHPHPLPSHAAPVAHKFVSLLPGLNLNSLTFFKSQKILRARFRCMTSFTSSSNNLSGIFTLIYLNDTSYLLACEHLRSCCTYITHVLSERFSA